MDFEEIALDDIDHRTTVLILGDARSNYGDPRGDILKKIHARAACASSQAQSRAPHDDENSGDSEMRKLQPYLRQGRHLYLAEGPRARRLGAFAERSLGAALESGDKMFFSRDLSPDDVFAMSRGGAGVVCDSFLTVRWQQAARDRRESAANIPGRPGRVIMALSQANGYVPGTRLLSLFEAGAGHRLCRTRGSGLRAFSGSKRPVAGHGWGIRGIRCIGATLKFKKKSGKIRYRASRC